MNELRLVPRKKGHLEVVESETGEVIDEIFDYVLAYLVENELPLTIRNYLGLAYMGDIADPEELGPEDAAEFSEILPYLAESETEN